MQATEQIIKSVVEQVLKQLGPSAHASNGQSRSGKNGVFHDVNEAVEAATVAFEQLSERTIEDRKRIIDHIRRIRFERLNP